MLEKQMALFWNEIEHDLYEENGHVFGVELDLFNNQKNYYCKIIKKSPYSDKQQIEHYEYLHGDIYSAIDQFNSLLEVN